VLDAKTIAVAINVFWMMFIGFSVG